MQLAQGLSRTAGPVAAADTRPLLAGFLSVQFFLGYEWLMSGLAKVTAADFPGSLAATLTDATKDQSGWYKSFIDGVVIPNGQLFGTLVMIGELAVGTALIAASLIWLARWSRLGPTPRTVLLGVVVVAGVVGAFMSLNFHLAMGAAAPWVISADPNDQGVDLDSLMTMLQAALAVVGLAYLVRLRGRPIA